MAEAMPIVVIEPMALGLPMVASSVRERMSKAGKQRFDAEFVFQDRSDELAALILSDCGYEDQAKSITSGGATDV